MKVDFTIIHFSQEFTKGKPQLGCFSRIYNKCSDTNKYIIYTISTLIEVIDDILIIQVPVKECPSGMLNQFKPIANKINKLEEKALAFHSSFSKNEFKQLQHSCRKFWEEKLTLRGFFNSYLKTICA